MRVAGQLVGHILQRNMDRHRDGLQLRSGQHHHRQERLTGQARAEIGEKFGMAGKLKTRFIEHGFGDRIGDDGGDCTVHGEPHGGFDGAGDSARIGGIRQAGMDRAGAGHRQNRKRAVEDGASRSAIGLANRDLVAKRAGAFCERPTGRRSE